MLHSKVRKITTIFGVVAHSSKIAKSIQTCLCLFTMRYLFLVHLQRTFPYFYVGENILTPKEYKNKVIDRCFRCEKTILPSCTLELSNISMEVQRVSAMTSFT